MSKIALTPNASGSGTFTLAAPNSNTDRSLTLPDGAGTLDRLERTGNVLQVVEAFKTDTETSSVAGNGSFEVSDLVVNITPTSSTSKFLCVAVVQCGSAASGSAGRQSNIGAAISRGGTMVRLADADGNRSLTQNVQQASTSNDGYLVQNIHLQMLDAPSSSSALQYAVRIINIANVTETLYVNRTKDDDNDSNYRSRSTSSLVVMEIAG